MMQPLAVKEEVVGLQVEDFNLLKLKPSVQRKHMDTWIVRTSSNPYHSMSTIKY
jgi:hypothetical protein